MSSHDNMNSCLCITETTQNHDEAVALSNALKNIIYTVIVVNFMGLYIC